MKQIQVTPVQDYNGERYLIPPGLEPQFWQMLENNDHQFEVKFNRFKVEDFSEHTLHYLQAKNSPLWRALEEAASVDGAPAKGYQEVKQLSGPHNWIYIVPANQEDEFKELVAALDKATAKRWAGIRDQFEAKFGHLRSGKYNPRLFIKTDQP